MFIFTSKHIYTIPTDFRHEGLSLTATWKGMDVAFVCVPGLRGIMGNDEADKGAK